MKKILYLFIAIDTIETAKGNYGVLQFGLINYNETAWISWLPFFNYAPTSGKI